MNNRNMNSLAETLAKTGLASSAAAAQEMAENIMGTEDRVAKKFDNKNEEINKTLERKKTYEEEIDDLIERTRPEKKDFHVMVSGYKKEKGGFKEPEAVLESPENQGFSVQQDAGVSSEPAREKEEIKVEEEPVVKEKPEPQGVKEESGETNQAISNAIKSAKPVYTDSVGDDDRLLNELMDEQAEEVYSNKSETAEQQEEPERLVADPEEVVEVAEEEQEQEDSAEIEEDEEFILDEAEEAVAEEKQESKKDFENPIEEVDLMDHFNFS